MEDVAILALERLGGQCRTHGPFDFLRAGPDFVQEDRASVLAGAERFLDNVHIDAAGQRVSHH